MTFVKCYGSMCAREHEAGLVLSLIWANVCLYHEFSVISTLDSYGREAWSVIVG